MKRDMDVVRELLLTIEGGTKQWRHNTPFPECLAEPDVVSYHLRIMEQARLLDVQAKIIGGMIRFNGLTWTGHEFIDAIRDDGVWKRTKERASKVGGVGFGVLVEIAKAYAKGELTKLGYLPHG